MHMLHILGLLVNLAPTYCKQANIIKIWMSAHIVNRCMQIFHKIIFKYKSALISAAGPAFSWILQAKNNSKGLNICPKLNDTTALTYYIIHHQPKNGFSWLKKDLLSILAAIKFHMTFYVCGLLINSGEYWNSKYLVE